MKRFVFLGLALAIVGGMVFSTGCGGGGDGDDGGILGPLTTGNLNVNITASSPGGSAVFASSIRQRTQAGIFAQTSSGNYELRITPTGQAAVSTSTVTISANGQVLTFPTLAVAANSTDGQYKMEILPVSSSVNAQGIFKWYFVTAVENGATVTQTKTVTTSETAMALAYDAWPDAVTQTINAFVPNSASITALASNLDQRLNDIGYFTPSQQTSFQWGNTVTTNAQQIGQNTPLTTTSISVSGFVTATDGNAASDGIVMTLISKANYSQQYSATTRGGNYSIAEVPNGTYTLTPVKSGYTFTPAYADVTVNGASVTGQNFRISTSTTQTSVGMSGNRFSPSPATIDRGQTVVWSNNDTVAHTVTSNSGLFDSSTIQPGGFFSFTFQSQGTFAYHCSIYTNMTGAVIVNP